MAWTKPPRGRMKANVDVAIFEMQGRIGVGCVIRDSGGNMVIEAFEKHHGGLPSPEG